MARKAFWGVVAGGVVAAALATVAVTVPASAETVSGQAVAASATADRPAYCDKIDKALKKRQAVVGRLGADANTRGSIAWLNAKAASASSDGNAELAKLYTDLANLRTQVQDPLKTITADLTAVQQAHCS